MKRLVFTVIGPDRSGIVAELAAAVSDSGGNWLESHMANLAGQFAGIVEIDIGENDYDVLGERLAALKTQGLQVVLAAPIEEVVGSHRSVGFELVGKDHPGILREITECVAKSGASIEVMETECFSASMSAEEMFRAEIHIRVPQDVSLEEIEQSLQAASEDLMMDLLFE